MVVSAQTTLKEWADKAVEAYPELGQAGSPMNQKFVERVNILKVRNPEFFADASWPYRLANILRAEAVNPTVTAGPGRPLPIAEAPPSLPASGESGALVGDVSEPVDSFCGAMLRAKLKAHEIKDKEEVWFGAGGRILFAKKAAAMELAHTQNPDFAELFAKFLTEILSKQRRNTNEDREWLFAFLCQSKFHYWASSIEEVKAPLLLKLLAELEDPELVVLWLRGNVNIAKFVPALPVIPPEKRLPVLEDLVEQKLELGGRKIPREDVLAIALKNRQYDLVLQFPIAEWGESIFLETSAPAHRFSETHKDWKEYLRALELMDGFERRKTAVGVLPKENVPGLLEAMLLHHFAALPGAREALNRLDAVSAKWAEVTDRHAQQAARILPALRHHFEELSKKEASPQ
jgi:hypothetical protein